MFKVLHGSSYALIIIFLHNQETQIHITYRTMVYNIAGWVFPGNHLHWYWQLKTNRRKYTI